MLAAASGKQACKQSQRLVFRTHDGEWVLNISLKAQGGRKKESNADTGLDHGSEEEI